VFVLSGQRTVVAGGTISLPAANAGTNANDYSFRTSGTSAERIKFVDASIADDGAINIATTTNASGVNTADKSSNNFDANDKFVTPVNGVYTFELPSNKAKHVIYGLVAIADAPVGVYNYVVSKTYPDGRVETTTDRAQVTGHDANQLALFGTVTAAGLESGANTKFLNNFTINEPNGIFEKGTYKYEFTFGSVTRSYTINIVDRPLLKVSGVKLGSSDLVLFDGEFVRNPGTLTGEQALSIEFTKQNITSADFYTVEASSLIGSDFVRPASTPVQLKDLTSIDLGTLTGVRSANDKIYVTIKTWKLVNFSVLSTRYQQVGETETLIIGFHSGMSITAPTATLAAVSAIGANAATLNPTVAVANSDIYWYVNLSTEAAPSRDTILNAVAGTTSILQTGLLTAADIGARPIALTGLRAGTAFNYYLVLVSDSADKSLSIVYSGTFTTSVPTLTFAGTTNGTTLTETSAGVTTNTITITLVGDTYTGADASVYTLGNQYSLTGVVPSNMTLVVTKTSATVLTISLTGTATAHEDANDVTLTLGLNNSAFTNGLASRFTNASGNSIIINFND
jgi:hypothetical protein